MSLSLILAVLLDHWLGEPKKYHPLVLFGNLAKQTETKLRCPWHSAIQQKLMGVIALFLMIMPFSLIIYFLDQWPLINAILAPVILYFCIAANSLKLHAVLVLQALEKLDIDVARQRVAMIVSRETDQMTASDVRRATIESVLENGADAVFAPLFWFCIAGPTGAVLYRLSNTLDAMWGYKNQRYIHFGWAAARFDDFLNWIPARLTALSYACMGQTKTALNCWRTQAALLDSPNAGPVMTTGAGSLNIQLGGPAWYHGKLKEKIYFGSDKSVSNDDIQRANSLINRSLILWLCIIIILETIGAGFA